MNTMIKGILLAALLLAPAHAAAQTLVLEYYHLDALGSVRVVTDQNRTVVRQHDFFPFGEEVPPQALGGDAHRFTGKPRDVETGLDYFGARQHSTRSGRFMTRDPIMNSQLAVLDPQRWNRYAYALNNPLVFVDPTGQDPVKNQLGTAQGVAQVLAGVRGLSILHATSSRNPFAGEFLNPTTSQRYIAAESVKGMFIDMQHFLAAAGIAEASGRVGKDSGFALANALGAGVEVAQWFTHPKSSFAKEDLVSNAWGAYFGAYVYDRSKPLGPQVEAFLTALGAMTPEELKKKHPDLYASLAPGVLKEKK